MSNWTFPCESLNSQELCRHPEGRLHRRRVVGNPSLWGPRVNELRLDCQCEVMPTRAGDARAIRSYGDAPCIALAGTLSNPDRLTPRRAIPPVSDADEYDRACRRSIDDYIGLQTLRATSSTGSWLLVAPNAASLLSRLDDDTVPPAAVPDPPPAMLPPTTNAQTPPNMLQHRRFHSGGVGSGSCILASPL